ncbi:Uncharacterised protein [uncultured archaeon]|nr:Uncharacterised protein [uncultured archaeon]
MTMSNIKKAVSLTNAFISLPRAEYLLSLMIIIGVVFGILTSLLFASAAALDKVFEGALQGLFLLSIPAVLTSLLIKLMIRKIPFRRILAASLIGQIIYALAYFAFLMLSSTAFAYKEAIIFVAASLAFVIWFVVARFVFILKWRSFLFAALQVIIYGVFLITGTVIAVSGSPMLIIGKFFIASAVFLGFVYLFFMIINAPMKRNFGLNTLDAVSLFLAHWFYESKTIEDEFERVGEEAETVLSAFLFKRKSGTVAFVTPYVHYGPFGSLGGSGFSHLLAEELGKKYGMDAFIFHGTVTHDLNPVASSELEKIMSAFDSNYKKCRFSNSSVAFSRGRSEECFAESLLFKNSAFVGISRAPETTEDVNFGLGLALMAEGEKRIPSVSVIDQHNAETGDITSFEPGSGVGFNYMAAVSDSLSRKTKPGTLKIGVSHKMLQLPNLGAAGVKIAVLSSSPHYALILIDSNGISPELQEKIVSAARAVGAGRKLKLEAGVFTTDTHSVNAVRGVVNPLRDEGELVSAIEEGVREAIDEMQPAAFASFKERFKIHVLGAKQSIEIVSTVNAVVAVAKIAAPLIIIGSIISILWIISKI